MTQPLPEITGSHDLVTRRSFLKSSGAAALGYTLLAPGLTRGADAGEKLNVGLIGAGGRGRWIGDLFAKNGGFNLVAVADYFPDRVDAVAKSHNLPASNCFTGLNGYKKLLDLKLDAVAIVTPPYFHPQQVADAVAAGKHIYLAKPIAVDVPGCLTIAEAGKKSDANNKVLLVDFQTRATPAYQEVLKRVHAGEIGKLVSVYAEYQTNLMFQSVDDSIRKNPGNAEVRFRGWGVDRTLSGDVITEQNIHALDVATWFVNANPIKAYGSGGRARPFVGDCWDHFEVLFYFPDNLVVTFSSKQVGFAYDDIMVRAHGMNGTAETHYGGKVWMKSREDAYNGTSPGIYQAGAEANIAAFHKAITSGDFSNPTVAPSVRSNLTTILGRTAAYKNAVVTWDEMMKANEKWEADLKGLKA